MHVDNTFGFGWSREAFYVDLDVDLTPTVVVDGNVNVRPYLRPRRSGIVIGRARLEARGIHPYSSSEMRPVSAMLTPSLCRS